MPPLTNHVRRCAVGTVALCCNALACQHSDTGEAELEELQSQVESLLQETGLPGISVAVVEQGGEMLLAAAGHADVERSIPLQPGARFFTGSVAKNIYATIAFMLVEEGRLNLGDPLSAYVDWPRGSEITIRMLLNHTSGIPEYMAAPLFASRAGHVPEFTREPHSPADILQAMPSHD
ncbi:MAG: beta-lactamase family protein, partial [Gemmatimonadota bacterium]